MTDIEKVKHFLRQFVATTNIQLGEDEPFVTYNEKQVEHFAEKILKEIKQG